VVGIFARTDRFAVLLAQQGLVIDAESREVVGDRFVFAARVSSQRRAAEPAVAFRFLQQKNDETPKKFGFKFCPYCGKLISWDDDPDGCKSLAYWSR